MRILVLGGSGFIGRRIVDRLQGIATAAVVVASRAPVARPGTQTLQLDALDASALERALADSDAVVNCITGNAGTIGQGAQALARAVTSLDRPLRTVHLSTMSVYGSQQGTVDESAACIPDIGWYGKAKIHAERVLAETAMRRGTLCLLRPGCVYGPGSRLWNDRIAGLLRSGRLGDLGPSGDGWSNLVHVDDVARAVVHCLVDPVPLGTTVFNLADPRAPRWNDYFRDLALTIGAVPLRYLPRRRMVLESLLLAPPLKLAERVLDTLRLDRAWLPESIPPSLLRLWGQHIRLDSRALERAFDFRWASYEQAVQDGARASGGCAPYAR